MRYARKRRDHGDDDDQGGAGPAMSKLRSYHSVGLYG